MLWSSCPAMGITLRYDLDYLQSSLAGLSQRYRPWELMSYPCLISFPSQSPPDFLGTLPNKPISHESLSHDLLWGNPAQVMHLPYTPYYSGCQKCSHEQVRHNFTVLFYYLGTLVRTCGKQVPTVKTALQTFCTILHFLWGGRNIGFRVRTCESAS